MIGLGICTLFGVKVIRDPTYDTTLSEELRQRMLTEGNESSNPFIQRMAAAVRQMNINEHLRKLPARQTIGPWERGKICVIFPDVPKKDSVTPAVLKQLVLAEIGTLMEQHQSSIYQCYTDGSLKDGKQAGCAFIAYKDNTETSRKSQRLHDWASTTQTELKGLRLATEYLLKHGSGVIFCDSKPALQALNSAQNTSNVVNDILANVIQATQKKIDITFMWLPSHIGVRRHDQADGLAKAACNNATIDEPGDFPLARVKHLLIQAQQESLQDLTNTQRPVSISIPHYERTSRTSYKYGTHKILTRQCDVVAAKIRLGYTPIWQLNELKGRGNNIDHTKCALCGGERMRTLVHYLDQCPIIKPLLPPRTPYQEIINLLLETNLLEDILVLHPKFCHL